MPIKLNKEGKPTSGAPTNYSVFFVNKHNFDTSHVTLSFSNNGPCAPRVDYLDLLKNISKLIDHTEIRPGNLSHNSQTPLAKNDDATSFLNNVMEVAKAGADIARNLLTNEGVTIEQLNDAMNGLNVSPTGEVALPEGSDDLA